MKQVGNAIFPEKVLKFGLYGFYAAKLLFSGVITILNTTLLRAENNAKELC